MRITVTAIKADVGSIGGHTRPSDELLSSVERFVKKNKAKAGLIDTYIGYTGDDIHILMSHKNGVNSSKVHKLAWDAFKAAADVAKGQGLYGAGQDLLKDSFSGNVKGMGPGVAEMEFEERPNEAFALITMDKTEPGAFNYPLYRLFCEPSANTGLIVNPKLASEVKLTVMDVMDNKKAEFSIPQDNFLIATVLMYPGRYVIDSVRNATDPILSATTDRLHNIGGTYVGKDDPAALIRLQKDFPATEEACSVFKTVHYVAGDTRGSHHMPLMPVKIKTAATANYCIPIVSALLFSMHEGKFTAHTDAFETPDWDYFRTKAVKKAEMMREQGFVHPATLIPEELEYSKGYRAMMGEARKRFK
ncbi:MAG: fructose-1,6-bisphosphatase [Candidatus Marsarchaeota archaeon]|nr:fructose-1,6-bisphosphatase [Candidatus Marsarchaeota archaeon]MCL5412792.1 fructose-1,6-bisphosphatase [Candidatus Marsarchaeota archaeon]